MLDPSTADVTARVDRMLSPNSAGQRSPGNQERNEFLAEKIRPRWPVVWALGRQLCLWHERRFARDGSSRSLATLQNPQHAASWLRSVQNTDGGFGESLHSYTDSNWRARAQALPRRLPGA